MGHLHLWATVLHLLHVAVLVEYAVAPMADHDRSSSLLPHGFVSDVSLRAAFRWKKTMYDVAARRYGTPSVAAQLCDESERWLLPRNGVTRSIALSRGRGIEDCSVLGINIVCSYVSYHFVHDTLLVSLGLCLRSRSCT